MFMRFDSQVFGFQAIYSGKCMPFYGNRPYAYNAYCPAPFDTQENEDICIAYCRPQKGICKPNKPAFPPAQEDNIQLLWALILKKLLKKKPTQCPPQTPAPPGLPEPPVPPPPRPRPKDPSDPRFVVAQRGNNINSIVWGDPHFVATHRGSRKQLRYEFQGRPGKIYAISSSRAYHLNAKFQSFGDPANNANTMGEIGIKIGTTGTNGSGITKVKISAKASENTVVELPNGQRVELTQNGQKVRFDTGIDDASGNPVLGEVERVDANTYRINSGERTTFAYKRKAGEHEYLDIEEEATILGLAADGTVDNDADGEHGLLSQIDRERDYDDTINTGSQGEGVIDGTETDYLEEDLFSSNFRYSKFGKAQRGRARFGHGSFR